MLRRSLVAYASICFFATYTAATYYNSNRQENVVSKVSASVIKIMPIGHQYKYFPIASSNGIEFKLKRIGFGVTGHGSGVFIQKDGTLITCNHVVENTPLVEIMLKNGIKVKAYVLGRDKDHDIAILKPVNKIHSVKYVRLGKNIKCGLTVFAVGFPGPFDTYVTNGIISGFLNNNVFSDVVIAPGSSGGGVFTRSGYLVGLAQGITGLIPIPVYQGFSTLVPLNHLRDFVNKYDF